MLRVLRFAAAALILFILIVEGLPRIRTWIDDISRDTLQGQDPPDSGAAEVCVHQASETNLAVHQEIRQVAKLRADPETWLAASQSIDDQLRDATDKCGCSAQACLTASRALDELRGVVDDFERLMNGDGSRLGAHATRQERVVTLLEQARIELR